MYFYCPYFFSKIAREKNLDKRLTLTVFFRGQKRDLKFPISRHHWYGKRRHNINRICFFPTKTVYHKNTEGTRGGGGEKSKFRYTVQMSLVCIEGFGSTGAQSLFPCLPQPESCLSQVKLLLHVLQRI